LITIYLTGSIYLLNKHLQDDVSKSERGENSTKKLASDRICLGIRNPFIKHIFHQSQRRESIFHPGKTESANQKRNYQGAVRGQLKTTNFIFANGPPV
jgi:hypothetical protein